MRSFHARIDRPLGSCHPKHPDMIYPVNYGYVPDCLAPDGEEQDVYVLGVDQPIASFAGDLIAVIHRRDDVEDKWVLAPRGMTFTAEEIMAQVHFQEQYFDSRCVLGEEPVCFIRAGIAQEKDTVAMRVSCLREVCGDPGMSLPDTFLRDTLQYLRTTDHVTILAMDGSRSVGCATLCFYRCLPTPGHPSGRRAHLMNVYVAPSHRRRGIARRMLGILHREAEKRGVTEIRLDATETGRALYLSLGYQPSDEAMTLDIGR